MQKDFFKWHGQKSNIHEVSPRPYFHEREVWFVKLGANVGFEQDGRGKEFLRPVIILKKFSRLTFWAIPTTRKVRNGKYYLPFSFSDSQNTTAILSQLRLIDSKRLVIKIGYMSKPDFTEMKKRLTEFLQ